MSGAFWSYKEIERFIYNMYLLVYTKETTMATKEDLVMTKHAQDEAMDDGISRTEIAEAVTRGPKIKEGNHFLTVYRHFTVVYERLSDRRYRIITVHLGRPKNWKWK